MRSRSFVVGALAFCLCAPAMGQEGTRIPDPAVVPRDVKKADETTEAQRVMNEYGACIVKTSRRRAEAAVKEFPGTKRASEAMKNLASSNCLMDGELRFKFRIFRGSLFEALYETEFKSSAADISATAPIDYFAGAPDQSAGEVRQQVALLQFADCVTRAAPASARDLIMSKVGRAAEKAAFGVLMPALSRCLTQGVELKFSRPILRGFIAETLYRLSRAAAAPATMVRGR